jgi:hypothetical protein
MKKIVTLAFVVLIGYAVWQWINILEAKGSLAKVVNQQLDFVNENSQPAVKQKLVDEARKLGIELSPTDIQIKYEDTEKRSVAQNFTARILTFVNKRAEIKLSYNAYLAVIPLRQEIEDFRIRQIQAREREKPEMQQLLDPDIGGTGATPQ